MKQNRRRESRKAFTARGRVFAADGSSLGDCYFYDVSQHGARVGIGKLEDLPDEVILMLSRDGTVRRRGRIVWRDDGEIGVRFIYQDASGP